MIYLSSFKLSNQTLKNPNIYPYNVFRDKYIEPFSFPQPLLPFFMEIMVVENPHFLTSLLVN